MACTECGRATLSFAVPPSVRSALPGDEPGAALCPHCLTLHPVSDPPADLPDFSAVGEAFPTDPDAAVPLAVMVGLLSSLALNRSEIATLLEQVERAGVDPLLVLDRLADDPGVDSVVDLRRRRHQLEQLL